MFGKVPVAFPRGCRFFDQRLNQSFSQAIRPKRMLRKVGFCIELDISAVRVPIPRGGIDGRQCGNIYKSPIKSHSHSSDLGSLSSTYRSYRPLVFCGGEMARAAVSFLGAQVQIATTRSHKEDQLQILSRPRSSADRYQSQIFSSVEVLCG